VTFFALLRLEESLSPTPIITMDGKTLNTVKASDFLRETLTIDLPAGLGQHVRSFCVKLGLFLMVLRRMPRLEGIVFAVWRAAQWVSLGLLSVAGGSVGRCAAAVPPGFGPNPPIILISVDTLRPDRLGCYGSLHTSTPNIDAMSKGGTLFSAISSQVPLTLPSHTSLFTSNYPFATGIEDNGQELRPNTVTLATILKAHGYHTAAFVGGFVLDRRFGLNQGFDDYDSSFDLHRQAGKDPGDIKRFGEDVVRAATVWLEDNSDQSFFLFLHLYDLHTPYNFPATFRLRNGETGYDAEVRYVDKVLGGFWEFLSQKHLLDKTLVVLISDHGESLGEHGEGTHGYFIYQSTLWVPLIIHWPAAAGSFPKRVDQAASLLDIAPTILQFAGVPPPSQFQGQGLLELLKPGTGQAQREIYSESLYAHYHFGCSSLQSLRAGRYKYIQAPNPELYDLVEDPAEKHNVYGERKSIALALREQLLTLHSRMGHTPSTEGGPLDPETMARLMSLGYVALSSPHAESSQMGADPKDRVNLYEEYGHALTLASAGRFEESNTLLERLLTKYPDLTDPRMTLGLNYQRQGEHARAALSFREVLKGSPLYARAHYNLAVSCVALQQLDEAVKELQATLAISPNYASAEDLLGSACIQKKDFAQAQSHFRHVLTVDPNDFYAHYNLGTLAAVQKQWDQAEDHLQAALKADAHDPGTHNTLGSVYLERGDLAQASTEFGEAIRLNPKFAAAHYNMGLVLEKQSKESEAAQEFRRALAADPQYQPARIALDRLGGPPK
jgi:tetratricopeptide (TPR) repeat protein